MKLSEHYVSVNRHPDFTGHGQGENPEALGLKLAMKNPATQGPLCTACFLYHRGECA